MGRVRVFSVIRGIFYFYNLDIGVIGRNFILVSNILNGGMLESWDLLFFGFIVMRSDLGDKSWNFLLENGEIEVGRGRDLFKVL